MNGSGLEQTRSSKKEKWLYALAFGIIALMLYVVGFPVFILLFFGVLVFFIWRAFTSATDNETRQIFDFYLSASEILSEAERRWFGFELNDTIAKGERLAAKMTNVPPLVYFALGALHAKTGDHGAAVRCLEKVCDENAADELSIVYPTKEFRDHVRILRKIERSPADAPLTSAAVRSLEEMRTSQGPDLLAASRRELGRTSLPDDSSSVVNTSLREDAPLPSTQEKRSTISEVLHDVYDSNIQ